MDFDKEPEKLYYTIGEVAGMFKVNTSLIRFWEREFEALRPKKNKKGNRLFTPVDVENLKLIFHLVKEKGYTLEGARKIIDGKRNEVEKNLQIKSSLEKIRLFLKELQEQL